MIGVASLPKWWAAVLLVPLLLARQWRVLPGFGAVTGLSATAVAALSPGMIGGYLTAGRATSLDTVARLDNGALLPWLAHHHGGLGVTIGVPLVAVVAGLRWRSWDVWMWVAVATLPIAWVYSLAPLAPGILHSLRSRGPALAFAGVGLAVTFTAYPFGHSAAAYQALAVMLFGLALLFGTHAAPFVPATPTARSKSTTWGVRTGGEDRQPRWRTSSVPLSLGQDVE